MHDGMPAFLAGGTIATGIHTIVEAGRPIDLYVRRKEARPLLVFLHGASPARGEAYKLPSFLGIRISAALDASLLAISDPSLYLDPTLQIAWYSETEPLPVRRLARDIIDRVADDVGATRIVFCGGSGGGYASLLFGLHYPSSLAVIWNPQTDIAAYGRSFVEHFGRVCVGLPRGPDVAARLRQRLTTDLGLLYREGHRGNRIICLQNATDRHVTHHMQPFLTTIGATADDVTLGATLNRPVSPWMWLCMRRWGDGHARPPNGLIAELLAHAIRDHGAPLDAAWSDGSLGSVLDDMLAQQSAGA